MISINTCLLNMLIAMLKAWSGPKKEMMKKEKLTWQSKPNSHVDVHNYLQNQTSFPRKMVGGTRKKNPEKLA